MKFMDKIKFAFDTLMGRKSQSVLTILGVFVGISTIVSLLALGQGYEIQTIETLQEQFDTNLISISGGFGRGSGSSTSSPLRFSDVDYLKSLNHVTEALAIGRIAQTIVSTGDIEISVTFIGVDYQIYTDLFGDEFYAEYGEINSNYPEPAIVVGSLVYEYETGLNLTEIGSQLNITTSYKDILGDTQNLSFNATLIGVLPYLATLDMGMSNSPSDLAIYMDLDQFLLKLPNVQCNTIIIKIDDISSDVIDETIDTINSYYSNTVFVLSSQQQINSMTESFQKTETFLIAIAAISLIVAGIGIMNIMTVSLMERTKEIGILKSLGAEDHNVLELFIYEAVLIGIIGSLTGILGGWLMASFFGSNFMSITGSTFGFGGGMRMPGSNSSSSVITPVITLEICLESIIFGLVISIVFSIIPAIKAARLRPVEALRKGD